MTNPDSLAQIIAELSLAFKYTMNWEMISQIIRRIERLDADMREQIETTRQQRAWRDLLTHKLIACGVAAHHPDPNLSKSGVYAGKWDSPQAHDVRNLRDERDLLRAELDACKSLLADPRVRALFHTEPGEYLLSECISGEEK